MKKSTEKEEAEFLEMANNINDKYLSSFQKDFLKLYIRSDDDNRMKLFKSLPETITKIKHLQNWQPR